MSPRRIFAWCSLVMTCVVLVRVLVYLSGPVRGSALAVWAALLVAAGLVVAAALWLRVVQRLHTQGRHRLWIPVAAYFLAVGLWAGLLGGADWLLAIVSGGAMAGAVRMHRREREVTLTLRRLAEEPR